MAGRVFATATGKDAMRAPFNLPGTRQSLPSPDHHGAFCLRATGSFDAHVLPSRETQAGLVIIGE